MRKRQAIILGVHSFLEGCVKVGSQYIAEGLADMGWNVDYVSTPSSLFDIYGPERRNRLKRVWRDRQDYKGVTVKPGLIEYAFRTLYPSHKSFLRSNWQIAGLSLLVPAWLKQKKYDLCIHDTSPTMVYTPLLNADIKVFRLNDIPRGFAFNIHRKLIDRFTHNLSFRVYDDIWAVSRPLARYARELNPDNSVFVFPNGVEDRFSIPIPKNIVRRPKTAIYLGSLSRWLDLDLLEKTAQLLPDWQFHIYGPGEKVVSGRTPNLHQFPPAKRDSVPHLLAGFQVGLIPFCNINGRMEFVERPLKFYEYIAAGLGVASTDIGSLRSGMGELAAYGNTPYDFSRAIGQASIDGATRSSAFNRRFVQDHRWTKVIHSMCTRISSLMDS